jgi:7-keto-8-aminopelargonate synthetase-like enzyme
VSQGETQWSQTPILSIRTGAMRDTLGLAKAFFDRGMVTTPFVEPSVPPGKGVLRLIPGAGVSRQTCEEAAARIGGIPR